MKTGKLLTFPTIAKVENSIEQGLRKELETAQVEVLIAKIGTKIRSRAIERLRNASDALHNYKKDAPSATIVEHPIVMRKNLLKGLQTTRLVCLVKMQSYMALNDLANPDYLKLCQQITEIEIRIEMLEKAPLKKVIKFALA